MQQIIVDGIVALAILFLLGWLFRSFVAKRQSKPACGSCAECAASKKPARQEEPGAVVSEG